MSHGNLGERPHKSMIMKGLAWIGRYESVSFIGIASNVLKTLMRRNEDTYRMIRQACFIQRPAIPKSYNS
jgi:hypothetical protein